ncbi:TPA: hypothetical protein EYO12_02830 [Candidatus Saccharibacteria bacterium]|nr:hypothetical protein [Candidatus Saccharibacteria bacterium]HIO88026.1 hypothetical protein [Candidatus Saccharibacteria bacterium]
MKNKFNTLITYVLRTLARSLLKKHSPKVIAITGSVGKTSTKRAVAAVVEQTYRTQYHSGNYNTSIGLPLAIYEIELPKNIFNPLAWVSVLARMVIKRFTWRYPYELLVLEYGIDTVGEMDFYLGIAKPDIGVVTAIQGAHLGAGLGDIDTVYVEKTKLAKAAKVAIANGDDKRLQTTLLKELPQLVLYGQNSAATYPAHFSQDSSGYLVITFESAITVKTQFVGMHSGSAFAAAWSVGRELGIDETIMATALENLQPYSGRMNLLTGKKSSIILDDSYNNVSVTAAKTAIDSLVAFPATKSGRKIVVFGMMNEMGQASAANHKELARYLVSQLKNKSLDQVLLLGDHPKKYMLPILAQYDSSTKAFLSPYELGNFLSHTLKKGDVVLIKGSQNGVFSEEVTALLLKNESDRSKLVRQTAQWQKIKHQQFS